MAKRLQGLHTDSQPIDQPPETYRDALNALINKKVGAISSEEGNIQKVNLSNEGLGSHEILGRTLVYDGRQILFLTDGNNNHEIGVFDGSSYTQILNNSGLNFQSDSNIEAVTVINNKDEVVVYWTDPTAVTFIGNGP